MTPTRDHVPLASLFLVFFRVGLFSFGGGLSGWIYREVVTLRGWMSDDDFFSGLALSQILPGRTSPICRFISASGCADLWGRSALSSVL